MRPTVATTRRDDRQPLVARPRRAPPGGARMHLHAGKHEQTYESRERAERHPSQALRESGLTACNDPDPPLPR